MARFFAIAVKSELYWRDIDLRGAKLYDVGLIRKTIYYYFHQILADALIFDAIMLKERFLEGIEGNSSYSSVQVRGANDFN